MIFRPLANKLIIEPLKAQDEVVNGIIIEAKSLGEKALTGTVIAAGPLATVKVGEVVAFARYGYDEVRDGLKTYLVMPEELVLTVIA